MAEKPIMMKDEQFNYLIGLIKSKYIEKITIDKSGIYVTKNGVTDTFEFPFNDVTNTASGLMPSNYKIKLDGIADGAEVNQNIFSNITFNDTVLTPDSKNDNIFIDSGKNINFTVDKDTKSIIISSDIITLPEPIEEGAFLRVVNNEWTSVIVPNVREGEF